MTGLQYSLPAELDVRVRAALARAETDRLVARIWAGDAAVWTGADEGRWLGWLTIAESEQSRVAAYLRLRDEVRAEGFTRVLLAGMGGSSLAPEVLARTFGPPAGFPALEVLDSTDPSQVRVACADLRSTLVIIASKSGTTLEPNILMQHLLARVREADGAAAGRRFIAITDPGSQLAQVAAREGFRATLAGMPSIGGRFSALSAFGLVPAALVGVEVARLLERAAEMSLRCRIDRPVSDNPGAVLGLLLGEAALAGRDKLTLVVAPGLASFGAWLEQLIAESTGKEGRAIVPVDGESPAAPDRYGTDRVFVQLRLNSALDADLDRAVEALGRAGHPVVRIDIADRGAVGAEFFRWEMATAVAGAVLRVNPFDQPDVEAAKQITRQLAADYETRGALPAATPVFDDGAVRLFADRRDAETLAGRAGRKPTLASWLRAHFARLGPGDYAALLAYLPMTAAHAAVLQRMRHRLRDARRVATSVGFGPRYLHSTGQAYKGGPNSGVFLLFTADPAEDVPVPGRRYSFGTIEAAQALGDFQALVDRDRRVLRAHLGADAAAGLAALDAALADALE